jgi:hypothetical protein
MEPLLNALRIPFRIIDKLEYIKPSIAHALTHADSSQWPIALAFAGPCLEVPFHLRGAQSHAKN